MANPLCSFTAPDLPQARVREEAASAPRRSRRAMRRARAPAIVLVLFIALLLTGEQLLAAWAWAWATAVVRRGEIKSASCALPPWLHVHGTSVEGHGGGGGWRDDLTVRRHVQRPTQREQRRLHKLAVDVPGKVGMLRRGRLGAADRDGAARALACGFGADTCSGWSQPGWLMIASGFNSCHRRTTRRWSSPDRPGCRRARWPPGPPPPARAWAAPCRRPGSGSRRRR